MIEITGYFCSGSNPNYYYFKVALEKSSSDQPMLANVRSSCSPVPNKLCKIYGNCCSIEKDTKEFIYYSQQNKGYYKRDQPCGSKVSSLENSSHSLQVFEVQRIYYLEVPRPFTNSSDMYCGFVQHISGCIKLQHSRVAFLRISSIDNSNKKIFLLMEETLFLIPYLSVGRRVDVLINELDIGQLCEDDYEENNVCDGTSTSPRINILRDMNIFLLDSIRFIHLHVKEKIAKSTCDTSSNCCCEFVDSCNIIENSLVKPRKCGCKEVFNIIKAVNFNAMCHQIRHNSVDFVESEMVVQGSILSIDLGGTMEIMVSARCRSENDIRSSPNSISVDSENFDDFTDDTVYTIIFSAPCPSLPILRKGTEVTLYSLLPVYLHDHLHGFAYTLRSSFSVISFPSSGSQYVIERNSKYTTAKLFGIDSNCNSKKWNKKRKHKTIDEEYELNSTSYSNSCGMFNIWRTKILRRIRRLLQVQNDETIAIVIQKLLCGAFLKGAENIDEKERILKKICSIIKLSNRSLLNEFNSIWYAQFSTIRSGEDSDYIASFLPQVSYLLYSATFCLNLSLYLNR